MSDNVFDRAVAYLNSPGGFFWQWEEDYTVLSWSIGRTIGYTEDIMQLLENLASDGLPSFGAVLLVLSACKDDWKETSVIASRTLLSVWRKTRSSDDEDLNKAMREAMDLLHRISHLSPHLRTGNARNVLLRTIFESDTGKMDKALAKEVLFWFKSSTLDGSFFESADAPDIAECFKEDIITLSRASKAFPTIEMLALKLKAGITQLPPPVEIEQPAPEDILQQLALDSTTAGLANLTHRIIAALHIPLHTHGSSDQSFGGVSDITNRGNFDRLLLSELAHDDLSLMARLANNEALYLRREDLPSNLEKRQVLLIDTTLKLWGLPRVFAVSAALACIKNKKATMAVESFALHGTTFQTIELSNKEGVVNALSQLDAALNCSQALTAFMQQWNHQEGDEIFLITDEENLRLVSAMALPLNFVITVHRNGHLQFYEYVHHRRKLVSEAKFDLEDLLFNVQQPVPTLETSPVTTEQFPLFFPASKVKFKPDRIFIVNRSHIVAVTIDQRVLYWSDRRLGAREIMSVIASGDYCIGVHHNMVYIVTYNTSNDVRKLYRISLNTDSVETTNIPAYIPRFGAIVADDDKFYFKYTHTYVINGPDGTVTEIKEVNDTINAILNRWPAKPDFHFIKKFVNCGYTVVNKVNWVYINNDGELGMDDRYLRLDNTGINLVPAHDQKDKKFPKISPVKRELEKPREHNPQVKYSTFGWDNGAQITVDSRGFLTLRSADRSIPEIIVLMVMETPVACWASDGANYGAAYFIGLTYNRANINAHIFYKKYIQRFIDSL